MVYDCFLFSTEFDVLGLRLELNVPSQRETSKVALHLRQCDSTLTIITPRPDSVTSQLLIAGASCPKGKRHIR